jgi:translation initiation factor IF-3
LTINRDLRVNDRIRSRDCRLIDENGTQVGVVAVRDALDMARSRNLDLIEVAATANPPVCRIMDYGKWKYEQGKREREAAKKQHQTEIKGVRMRPRTDEHDFQFKLRNALKFLAEGDKVKVTVIFRSREITHPEFARRSLERMAEAAAEIAIIEKPPSMEGRTMTMIMSPKQAREK